MEWIKDQIEWLDSVSKESASRLAEKICIGSKRLAERVWRETKRSEDWSWKVIKSSCKPLEPALEYVFEEHLLKIQSYIIISTWRETGSTISTILVFNCVVTAVYKRFPGL